jgi:hypothetical protein
VLNVEMGWEYSLEVEYLPSIHEYVFNSQHSRERERERERKTLRNIFIISDPFTVSSFFLSSFPVTFQKTKITKQPFLSDLCCDRKT